ncbi:hypothetical protein, partial [Candidatus Similichlamydia laticola]|uniref:hypothetical protein n=1 Tax=Candidatus Similichlamydia laticola TaxID=2170265 RepID=UPI0011C06F46
MNSVSISFISSSKGPADPIRVPIVDRNALNLRIQNFVRTKSNHANNYPESSWAVARQLFQDGLCEVFSCPNKVGASVFPLTGELLLFCDGTGRKGVTLCFFPEENVRIPPLSSFWEENVYSLEFYQAPRFSFSTIRVSCLQAKNGWIIQNEAGDFSLKGIEFIFIQMQKGLSLFCRKTEEVFPSPERPMREIAETSLVRKYIKVCCLSKWKGFSFYIRIPVLTEAELEERVQVACRARSQAMGTGAQDTGYLDRQQLFPPSSRVFDFPTGMGIHVPFGNVSGGEILCSHREEDNFFQMAFLLHSFERGEKFLPTRAFRIFPIWQVDNQPYTQSQLSGEKIHIFSSCRIRLLLCNNEEYRMQGACLRLLCSAVGGLWGMFIASNEERALLSPFRDSDEGPSSGSTENAVRVIPSPLIQRSVSVPCFNRYGSKPFQEFQIPLVDPMTLEACIQESGCFKKTYEHASEDGEKIVCKTLLKTCESELLFFPGPLTKQEFVQNLKLFSSDIKKRGLSIWYFPSNSSNRTKNNLLKVKNAVCLQETSQTERFAIPYNRISCLISEDVWFMSNAHNQMSLKGISLCFVQTFKSTIGLFCQIQKEDLSHPERPIITGGVVRRGHANYKNYIQVDCLSSCRGFSCQIRLPILKEEELQNEIKSAISCRKKAIGGKVCASVIPKWKHQEGLFEKGNCLIVSFPFGMEVDVPFGGCKGGDIFISYDGTHFKVLLISEAFKLKEEMDFCRKASQY